MSGASDACPVCGKPREAKLAPFCSHRCAQIDLSRWLKGSYVIPGAEPDRGSQPAPDDEENSQN